MSRNLVLIASLCSAIAYAAPLSGASKAESSASPRSDAAFLAMAAEADMTVAHIGQMAKNHASATEVKNLAEALAHDHTYDYEELTVLAAKVGDTIPKAIDRQNERIIAELNRCEGRTFDHAFLRRQSAEHEKLIDAFRREAEHGTNPQIKTYASKALPTIERHLHDAQNLIRLQS